VVAQAGTGKIANVEVTDDIALTAGSTLTVPDGATLDVGDGSLILTGGTAGDGAGAGAKLTGAGTVKFGNASITGGATGTWQAVGGTTIAFSATAPATAAITGTGTTPKLVGTDSGADANTPLITLGKGTHVDGDGVALTVTNSEIDLSTKGGILFPYVATTPSTLVLKGGAAGTAKGTLRLGADEGGDADNTNLYLKDGSHTVSISGTTAVTGASNQADATAKLISGGATVTTNDVTITGRTDTNAVTIKTGATLVAAATTA
jgi:hypothetical protein